MLATAFILLWYETRFFFMSPCSCFAFVDLGFVLYFLRFFTLIFIVTFSRSVICELLIWSRYFKNKSRRYSLKLSSRGFYWECCFPWAFVSVWYIVYSTRMSFNFRGFLSMTTFVCTFFGWTWFISPWYFKMSEFLYPIHQVESRGDVWAEVGPCGHPPLTGILQALGPGPYPTCRGMSFWPMGTRVPVFLTDTRVPGIFCTCFLLISVPRKTIFLVEDSCVPGNYFSFTGGHRK